MDAANGALVLVSCVHSLVMILVLALVDPKSGRRAWLGLDQPSLKKIRRLAVSLALLPGLAMLVGGLSVAFLVWFAFLTLAGWGIAMALATRGGRSSEHPRTDGEVHAWDPE